MACFVPGYLALSCKNQWGHFPQFNLLWDISQCFCEKSELMMVFYWPCFIFWSRKIASFHLSLIFLFTGENAKWQLCGPVQLFTSRELTNGACGKSVATIGASQQFPSFKKTSKQAWNLKTRNQRKLCHFVQQVR